MKANDYYVLFEDSFRSWKENSGAEVGALIKYGDDKWLMAFPQSDRKTINVTLSDVALQQLAEKKILPLSSLPPELRQLLETYRFEWVLSAGQKDFLILGKNSINEIGFLLLELCTRVFELLIRNKKLEEDLKRKSREMEDLLEKTSALHEISRSIESLTSLDNLLQDIVQKAMHLMNAESGSLLLFTEEGNELEFKVALGPKSDTVKPFRIKLGQGISGWVAEHGEPILIKDAYSDPRFDPSFDKRSGYRTRSFLCVPLRYKERILGVITILNRLNMEPFSEKDLELLLTFSTQAALAIENTRLLQEAIEKERLKADIKIASEIQKLLIPTDLPSVTGLEVDATYIPCKEMSGDFYDVISIKGGKWAFLMADVSGKSIPAAMLMSNFQASVRTIFQFSDDLAWIMENLNGMIMRQTSSDRYITVFAAIYDPATGTLDYVNAGHNPPFILSESGDIVLLNKGGIFLGVLPWEYEKSRLQLKTNDLIIIYTDGLVEAMNENEEEFELKNLQKLVLANRKQTLKELKETIIHAVRAHVGSQLLDDDFTLMLLRKTDANL
ncbi:PP2C family protein-serine/threonine phosphatase [Calditrichota bacterium LG25]